jgi:hypothetical protein
VLDAKGGENKGQSNKMDQLPLERFENSRVELLVCQNSFMSFVSKVGFLWGEVLIMKKGGEFLKSLSNLFWNDSLYASTCVFDLEIEI